MVSGKAKIAGVLGWPVEHSLSPKLHNYWLSRYTIDGAYLPFKVRPEDLADTVRALPKMGLRGFNLTLPHKEEVLPLLDSVDDIAASIGAVNTVIIDEQGKLHGTNTDAYGFMENLRQSISNLAPYLEHVLVLGAGGASRGVVKSLLDAQVPHITVINRTFAKAEALCAHFEHPALEAKPWNDVRAMAIAQATATMVVNTTSVGLKGEPAPVIDLSCCGKNVLVTDIVYTPLETSLLALAKTLGMKTVDGLGMLLYQAVPGFEAWFGVRPEVDAALRKHVLHG